MGLPRETRNNTYPRCEREKKKTIILRSDPNIQCSIKLEFIYRMNYCIRGARGEI